VPVLDRDGVAIHYEVHGVDTGSTPLLLSHGYSASSAMWAKNLDALGATRRVITWDLRGHGDSESPDDASRYSQEASFGDMTAILDACAVERAALGGHSLGGYLSLVFALDHPDRVSALLLFNTGPGFRQDAAREKWNRMAERFAAGFDERGLAALGGSPEVTGGRHDAGGLARAARGILPQHDARVITGLPGIAVPTLVVVGDRDRPFLGAADYLAGKIAGARKVVIPDAGHAANIDRPDVFNRAVLEFLEQSK
jgi:pimeloyl-ACP methyl ester carboxylesterase